MMKYKWVLIVILLGALKLHAAQEFLYNRDGFRFPNYTNQFNPVNLTPASVERLCGHVSCIRGTGDKCVLRAPMAEIMKRNNKSMSMGHCEGLSVVAEGVFTGNLSLKTLDPKANATFALKETPKVQSEIAYWFSTQYTNPTVASKKGIFLPNQALSILRNPGKETYTLHIFNPRKPGKPWDGHAVTPLKVIDMPDDKAKIAIYDSNYPNQTRLISVDKRRNTWNYPGFPATYPEQKAMILVPLSARLKQQNCPETGLADAPPTTTPTRPRPINTPRPQNATRPDVWPKGTQPQWEEEDEEQQPQYEDEEYSDDDEYQQYEQPEQWNLQVDNDGFSFDFQDVLELIEAFVGGVNEIRIPDTTASSIYQVATGKDRKFHLVASNLNAKEPTNLYVTSRGQAITIEGIKPHKGQSDEVFLGKDGETMSYSTKFAEPVTLTLAESLKDADYTIKIKPTAKAGGFDLRLHNIIDRRYGFHELELELSNHDGSEASYAIEMTRMDQESDKTFTHNNRKDLIVKAGDKNRIEYGQWHNDKESLTVIDSVAGEVEKSLQISDEQ